MRAGLAWLAAAALALPGCAAIESVFKPSPQPSPAPASAPTAPSPAPPPPAHVKPTPPPLPPLQPQLTEAEERRLRDEAARRIGGAERAVKAVQADALEPGQRETFGTIQSFLEQARQAVAARDYERASTLARKAETLAQDLPQAGR